MKPPGDVRDVLAAARLAYLSVDVADNRGRVVALNPATGGEAWQFQASSHITAVAASRGVVYAGTETGNLFALTTGASSN